MMFASLWGIVLSKVYSWSATFHWFAIVPLLFLGFWSYVVSGTPASHPKITNIELNYLRANALSPEGKGNIIIRLIFIFFLFNIIIRFVFSSIIQYKRSLDSIFK